MRRCVFCDRADMTVFCGGCARSYSWLAAVVKLDQFHPHIWFCLCPDSVIIHAYWMTSYVLLRTRFLAHIILSLHHIVLVSQRHRVGQPSPSCLSGNVINVLVSQRHRVGQPSSLCWSAIFMSTLCWVHNKCIFEQKLSFLSVTFVVKKWHQMCYI